jgi:transposase InsO family protein
MYSAIQCTILSGRYLIDKKGKSKNVHDINAAYTELLARYCQGNVEKLDSSKPSKATLKHYYNTKFTPERKAQAKYGERYFNANVRPLTSSVREWLVGSGYSYSIDSTPFDAGVAGEDRFPLARPVLYEVTDDYSSATVGFLLVLTPASYFNALNAMTVAISNKRELCIKYGLSIQHDEWPMEGLPKAFFGDLGSEFKTNKIEKLAEIHNVSMKNSGAGQPDKRSVGERSFGRVYNEIKHLIPGLVSQYIPKKAGGLYKPENYTLFLDELNKVLVLAVLSLNSKPLNGWDGDEDFPADLSTTPNNIWRWSIAHRTGPLARVDKDYFWFSMLPREDATVSKNNILTLDNIKFNCPNTTGLRVKSYNNRQKMTVVRDPSDASAIFLVPPDGESEYVRCELTPHYRRFKGLPWKDAKEAYEQRQYANANGQHDYEKLRVNVRQDTLNIVEEAEREREESIGNLTKSDQLAHLGDKSKQRENSQQIYGAIKPVPPLSKKDKLTEFELDKSPVIDSRTINFMEDED